jgi:hypothetical protein
LSAPEEDRAPILEARQAADIRVALRRTLEQRGDLEQAQAAYREAVPSENVIRPSGAVFLRQRRALRFHYGG